MNQPGATDQPSGEPGVQVGSAAAPSVARNTALNGRDCSPLSLVGGGD